MEGLSRLPPAASAAAAVRPKKTQPIEGVRAGGRALALPCGASRFGAATQMRWYAAPTADCLAGGCDRSESDAGGVTRGGVRWRRRAGGDDAWAIDLW